MERDKIFEASLHRTVNNNYDTHSYAIFDFDHTTIDGDIEDNVFFYLVSHLLLKLTPKELENLFTASPLNMHSHPGNYSFTYEDLIQDILIIYHWLFHNRQTSDEEFKVYHQTFVTKTLFFYQYVNEEYEKAPGMSWPTYFFAGYTIDELTKLIKDVIAEALSIEFRTYNLSSSPELPGRTGRLHQAFTVGIKLSKKMYGIYKLLENHHIKPYIVSASPKLFVEVFNNHYHWVDDNSNIYGIELNLKKNQVCGKISPQSIPTEKAGKTLTIRHSIAPKHDGKEPLIIFGDSMGDLDMFKSFTHDTLHVLLANNLNSEIGKYFLQKIEKNQEGYFVISLEDE